MRWRFRASTHEPWTAGEATFEARDVSPREVAEIIQRRPELAERVPEGLYARAIALYELAEAIERELAETEPPA